MITNFILIMVVLKLASSVPQHVGSFDSLLPTSPQDPFQQPYLVGPSGFVLSADGTISLVQHGDCSCTFGHKCYNDGDYLDDTCLELQCSSGTWTGTGLRTRYDCTKCVAWGDPHMDPYESHNYEIVQTGDFAITQSGFNHSASFGVYGKFEKCTDGAKSCVRSITYKEPGLTITLGLPTSDTSKDFCSKSPKKAHSKPCVTTLKVNNNDHTTPNVPEAYQFTGTSGNVLVFTHNHITGPNDLYCIAIVGSQGLSMALCQHLNNWPFLYVYAMPSLKRPTPSLLYGLCDVYTRGGNPSKEYTMRSKATTKSTAAFVHSWKV